MSDRVKFWRKSGNDEANVGWLIIHIVQSRQIKIIKLHIVTDIKATKRENDKGRPKPNAQLSD